jgi:hypothetical protein
MGWFSFGWFVIHDVDVDLYHAKLGCCIDVLFKSLSDIVGGFPSVENGGTGVGANSDPGLSLHWFEADSAEALGDDVHLDGPFDARLVLFPSDPIHFHQDHVQLLLA